MGYEVMEEYGVPHVAEEGDSTLRVNLRRYLRLVSDLPPRPKPVRHRLVPARAEAQCTRTLIMYVSQQDPNKKCKRSQLAEIEMWAGNTIHMHRLSRLHVISDGIRQPNLDLDGSDGAKDLGFD